MLAPASRQLLDKYLHFVITYTLDHFGLVTRTRNLSPRHPGNIQQFLDLLGCLSWMPQSPQWFTDTRPVPLSFSSGKSTNCSECEPWLVLYNCCHQSTCFGNDSTCNNQHLNKSTFSVISSKKRRVTHFNYVWHSILITFSARSPSCALPLLQGWRRYRNSSNAHKISFSSFNSFQEMWQKNSFPQREFVFYREQWRKRFQQIVPMWR